MKNLTKRVSILFIISILIFISTVSSYPVINYITDSPDPVVQNENITFTVGYSDYSNEVDMHICKSSAISQGICVDGEYCSKLNTTDNPTTCSYTVNTGSNTYDYYGYVCSKNILNISYLEPQILWNKTFNGSDGRAILRTSDNHFILGGSYWALLDKIDSEGNIVYEKKYIDLCYNNDCRITRIKELKDGNYIITGVDRSITNEILSGSKCFLAKVDKDDGSLIWNKTWGHELGAGCFDVIEDENRNIFVTGVYLDSPTYNHEGLFYKFDENGNFLCNAVSLWNRFGRYRIENFNETTFVTIQDSYISEGEGKSLEIDKIDENCSSLRGMEIDYSDLDNQEYYPSDLIKVSNYYYVLLGYRNISLMKLDENFNIILFNKLYTSDSPTNTNYGISFIKTSDGFIITGFINGSNNNYYHIKSSEGISTNLLLMKIDFDGNVLWQKIIDSNYADNGNGITYGIDNDEYYIFGSRHPPSYGYLTWWLVKLKDELINETQQQTSYVCSSPYQGNFTVVTSKLQITNIIPVQVIPGVDLVKDKTGIVRIVVESSEDNVNANVSLYFDNVLYATQPDVKFSKGSNNVDFTFRPNKSGINLKLKVEVEEI